MNDAFDNSLFQMSTKLFNLLDNPCVCLGKGKDVILTVMLCNIKSRSLLSR